MRVNCALSVPVKLWPGQSYNRLNNVFTFTVSLVDTYMSGEDDGEIKLTKTEFIDYHDFNKAKEYVFLKLNNILIK